MTTADERGQWKVLLEPCPPEQLRKIAASINPRAPAHQRNTAVLLDEIVRSTTSSEELLRRRYITSQVLWLYCQTMRLETPFHYSKKQLAQSVLRFWGCHKASAAKTSRLKSYEGEECKKILELLDNEVVTKYWNELYPGRTPVPSRLGRMEEILSRIVEVKWLLRKKGVTAHVLKMYLTQEGIYPWDNPSKPELIERVLAHISTRRPA